MNQDLKDIDFDSGKEVLEFTLRVGRYSENNSFDYTHPENR